MRIKFEKLNTTNGKVYVNFGNGFQEYEINEVKDSGIAIPEDCTDYSLIQIKGSSVILNNLDVISSIKTSDDNAISSEDITGIVLKDFNGKFDKSILNTYPKLTSVTIPDGVTSIGKYAFQDCKSITNISIPDTVTSIDFAAFWGCESLTSINIPDSITSISDYTFYNCGFTSINIPNSVNSIGIEAFSGCKKLSKINFKGTEEQWNAISKSAAWNFDCSDDIVINYNYTE